MAFFLRKGAASPSVSLAHWNGRNVVVLPSEGSLRLDASYFLSRWGAGYETLATLTPDIQRGALTHSEAKGLGVTVFHTEDSKLCADGIVRLPGDLDLPSRMLVQPGDILIARVGKRCLTYAALVESGQAVFTDCVCRIRVVPALRLPLWRHLSSPDSVGQRLALAHGVCAKTLAKVDLLRLPLQGVS